MRIFLAAFLYQPGQAHCYNHIGWPVFTNNKLGKDTPLLSMRSIGVTG